MGQIDNKVRDISYGLYEIFALLFWLFDRLLNAVKAVQKVLNIGVRIGSVLVSPLTCWWCSSVPWLLDWPSSPSPPVVGCASSLGSGIIPLSWLSGFFPCSG